MNNLIGCAQMRSGSRSRSRSYSYSPSPPPRGRRRGRSPSPRCRRGGGRSRDLDLPTSLLVRNLHRSCRPEDLRRPFEQFGRLKDIYLPRDYHTGDPRGFGFVQYVDPADAADAKHEMDGNFLLGRELTVVFAEENRKRPADMRAREQVRGRGYDRRRCPVRYPRSPRYSRSRSGSLSYYSPSPRRYHSWSISPEDRRYRRSYSPSRYGSKRSAYYSRSRSPSPKDYTRVHRERSLSLSE